MVSNVLQKPPDLPVIIEKELPLPGAIQHELNLNDPATFK
jgi:hypothetical protein